MMLLYVCNTCGHWNDRTLTEALSKALSVLSLSLHGIAPETKTQVYDCPNGHGPMVLVDSSYRLMVWNPAEKHDGNLDDRPDTEEYYHADVELQEDINTWREAGMMQPMIVCLSGGHGDCENSRILLDPGQALSLLAWLAQEKPALEQLVKESAEKA